MIFSITIKCCRAADIIAVRGWNHLVHLLAELVGFLVFLEDVITYRELLDEEGFDCIRDDRIHQTHKQDEPVVRRIARLLDRSAVVDIRVAFRTPL